MDILAHIFLFLFLMGFLWLYIWSIIWAAADAEKRGKSGCLVALLVLILSWPVGLLAWLIFRPELKLPPRDEE